MKKIGNIIAGTGLASAILGICGYDSNPVIAGIAILVGLALLYGGYRIEGSYTEREDILGSSVDKHEK